MKAVFTTFLLFLSLTVAVRAETGPKPDSINVYIFLLDACVICKHYSLTLAELHQEYSSEHLQFIGLFPNFSSKPASIEAFKEKYRIPFELKTDYYRIMTNRFGVTMTPEIVVYNHSQEKVLYKGRIDNTYAALGKRRRHTTSSELEDALKAIRDGKEILIPQTQSVGCLINKNDKL